VVGKGQPSCHAVREDTDDVYDGIAVQQVSTQDELETSGMYSNSFFATELLRGRPPPRWANMAAVQGYRITMTSPVNQTQP